MLFHTRTYTDPARAEDPHRLPSMAVESEDGKTWTVTCCLPGCLPDSDPMEFSSPVEALDYAWEDSDPEGPDFVQLFRLSLSAQRHRLAGQIPEALTLEEKIEDWIHYHSEPDGVDHVEELASEIARALSLPA